MKIGPMLAWGMVVADLVIAAGFAWDRDWRQVIYWAAAAVLTGAVTWPRG